jgi:hypothetical protein
MKKFLFTILYSILILISSCACTKLIKKGTISPTNFHAKIDFTTSKKLIVLPFELNGQLKNFIFDTGADYSLIQRDSVFGKTSTISGASTREHNYGSEIVESLKIGDINFEQTFALNEDLIGLKEQVPNFGGIIGQPIISKANWMIDYPNKTIEISNIDLSDSSFHPLKMKRNEKSPYTYIQVNGQEYKVIIDLGSTSTLNLPKDSKLAEELLKSIHFNPNTRERYTVGGLQTIKEDIGVVPLITLAGLKFENVNVNLNVSSQPRIGIGFFENCVIYIDNINGIYKIKQL